MKIIYRGVKPSDVEYIGVCNTCRTQAAFKRGEAKESPSNQREGSYLYVICPVCDGKIVSAFTKYVPPRDSYSIY